MVHTMAQLETLLSHEPSRDAFAQLLKVLRKWKENDLKAVLDELQDALQEWPDKCRFVDARVAWPNLNKQPPLSFSLIRHFAFPMYSITDKLIERFLSTPVINQLTSIYIYESKLSDQQVTALVQSPYLNNVRELHLPWNNIGDAGIIALANSPHMTRLLRLDLSMNANISRAGIQALMESQHITQLTSLSLANNQLGPADVGYITQAPQMAQLTHLNLSENALGDEGARLIAESPHMAYLTHLNLAKNEIGNEGIKALANSRHINALQSLNLFFNDIDDDGILYLTDATNMAQLEALNLECCDLELRGIKAIAHSPHLSKLNELEVPTFMLPQEGLMALGLSRHLKPSIRRNYLQEIPTSDLKKQAKQQGLKGYSKCKKEELIELLLTLEGEEDPTLHTLPKDEALGQLRELLARGSSRALFQEVIMLFRRWDDTATLELGLQYANEHMKAWPDDYRSATPAQCWPRLPDLDTTPAIELVRALTIEDVQDWDEYIEVIASAPQLAHMTELDLLLHPRERHWVSETFNQKADGCLLTLLQSPYLTGVKKLAIRESHLKQAVLEKMASLPLLSQLESLDLRHNNIEAQATAYLASLEQLSGLTYLDLSHNRVGKGVVALANSPYITGLKHLYLNRATVEAEGAEALANSTNMARLVTLQLSDGYICKSGARALAQSPYMAQLKELDLSRQLQAEEVAIEIANAQHMTQLTTLHLNGFELSDASFEALAALPQLTSLSTLDLRWTYPNAETVRMLANAPRLGQLSALLFTNDELRPEDRLPLCTSPYLAASIRHHYVRQLKKKELLQVAKEANLKGRSKMSKEQLLDALLRE